MAYTSYSDTQWARTIQTTLAEHIRDEEQSMMRNFKMTALVEANGRVSYNHGGAGFDWPVRYRFHQSEGNTGQTPRNFAARNLWKNGQLAYRGYQVTDQMYYGEFLENKGAEAIIKVYDGMTRRLGESLKHALGTEVYIDGSASGNETNWHGFESMFARNGTLNITDGTQRTANAADKVGFPNDTYAGLITNLGNYGGAAESGLIWPEGIPDSEYDFWTPLIVNYTSTAFGGSADTFRAQGVEALRYGFVQAMRNTSPSGALSHVFLARDIWQDLLNSQESKEEIRITSDNELRAFGFKDVVVLDGVEITPEIAITTTVGYGFNWRNIELRCQDENMFRTEGPEYDIDTQAFKAVVSTRSNLKFDSPRNFLKLDNIA